MTDALSILLVEDDEDLRELLVEVLQENGYAVVGAASGPEAVSKARETTFDLVITDIRMGEMNGLETLLEVREESPDFESMVITGYADEEIPAQALRQGVGEYLKKPFELGDFVKAVERLLGDYKKRRDEKNDLQDTRRVAIWGAEGKAAERSNSKAISAAKLSWEVAGELGFSFEEAEQLQLTTLLSALSGSEEPPPSSRVARLLLNDSLTGRDIVAASLNLYSAGALTETRPYVSELPEDLQCSETVKKALQQLSQFGSYGLGRDPVDTRKWQGLLSVAEALLQRADHRGAAQAFAAVAKDGGQREAVEALIGLARTHLIVQKNEAAAKWAIEAAGKCQDLGPSKRCSQTLEVGSILARLEHPKAVEHFESAREVAVTSDLVEMLPLAEIALSLVQKSDVEAALGQHSGALFGFANLPKLKGSLRWFLPLLLGHTASHKQPNFRHAARGLVLQFPEQVHQLMCAGELSQPASELALELMKRDSQEAEAVVVVSGADHHGPDDGPTLERQVLRCYSLGVFEVYLGEQQLDLRGWKSQKTRYLLAYLAAHHGKPVSEERILEDFWEGRSKSNLYAACSHLRRLLSPKGTNEKYIVRESGMIRLNYDLAIWHDLDELEELENRAKRPVADTREAYQIYRQAVTLYRGPYLDGCTMEWAYPIRVRVNRMIVTAFSRLIELALAANDMVQVEESANDLLSIDSCNQEATLALIQAMVAQGKPEQAARQYQRYCKSLERELGLEPPIEAMKAYHEIMIGVRPST
jgi:two-component SAPR family response regulator